MECLNFAPHCTSLRVIIIHSLFFKEDESEKNERIVSINNRDANKLATKSTVFLIDANSGERLIKEIEV